MVAVFKDVLKLLHPFMPFITEELWSELPDAEKSIVVAPFPRQKKDQYDEEVEKAMDFLIPIITAIRNLRSEMNIPPSKTIDVTLVAKDKETLTILDNHFEYIKLLGRLKKVSIGEDLKRPKKAAFALAKEVEIYMHLKGVIDLEMEIVPLMAEIEKLNRELARSRAKLGNEDFYNQAPPEIVAKEKVKEGKLAESHRKLDERI